VKGYDEECLRLAEHFAETTSAKISVEALAQHIQDAIEDFLRGAEAEQEMGA
jgi:hypothetical protein